MEPSRSLLPSPAGHFPCLHPFCTSYARPYSDAATCCWLLRQSLVCRLRAKSLPALIFRKLLPLPGNTLQQFRGRLLNSQAALTPTFAPLFAPSGDLWSGKHANTVALTPSNALRTVRPELESMPSTNKSRCPTSFSKCSIWAPFSSVILPPPKTLPNPATKPPPG
ncbi:hypothetical protein NDU88_003083 [Pleurodeles waltl]|uniref:Uncharacterized protein n=1 Tax=Pleurodeles waltl TaxID=8319 RepID=A0AAV7LKJ1_PLEWA|nr:hypothetical protein NDU88_003083 [Pleurodeles waltl]